MFVLLLVALPVACDAERAREVIAGIPSERPREAKPSELERVQPSEHEARDAKPRDARASPSEAQASEPAWTRPANPTDLRGDEVIPPGTSPSNAAAFRKLALHEGDGAPVGGIGAGGIHLDELQVGHVWAKSRCSAPASVFRIGVHEQVNVCMRVVHERGSTAELGVEWIRNGKQARRSKLSIGDMHALLTRAYLPISAGYEGEWQALIKSVDGTLIGEVAFTVER